MKEIILAKNAGFCFGVKRAVDTALKTQKQYHKKIYTLGPLIHNDDVVEFLKKNNIFPIEIEDINSLQEDDIIVIRSHGIPKKIFSALESKKLQIVNATCPFVENIQKKVEKYSSEGYNIVILGDASHPEVKGINGWCGDSAVITKDGNLPENLPDKICAVSQTTEKLKNWNNLLDNLKNKGEVLSFNTICAATDVRQKSTAEVAENADGMIVIGGKNSSNTTKLYQIASEHCSHTIHIENIKDLPDDFIKDNIKKIGITAGASTPDWIIREVLDSMSIENNFNTEDQKELMDKMDNIEVSIGTEIEAPVLSVGNDGVYLNIAGRAGRDGIIPFDELTSRGDGREYAQSLNEGDMIKAKIIRIQDKDNFIVCSRTEYEKQETVNELEAFYKNGETFTIKIAKAGDKGLVGYYKGIRVFVPASHIDLKKFTKNKEQYVNQDMEVKLIDFSAGRQLKVVASRKVILEEAKNAEDAKAWEAFNVGDVVKGEVKRFTKFGAFVEVNGIDGLLHLSQISWNHINNAQDVLKVGEVIDVKIIAVNKEDKKLSLSRKELLPKPWDNVEERYPVDTTVQGTVVRLCDFGAFVELEPGVDGLVHISKISHERTNNPADVLEIGQVVKAKILEVNGEKKRISLSIKDAEN